MNLNYTKQFVKHQLKLVKEGMMEVNFKKYETTKASFSEQVLLDLEAQFPNLAARLDEDRPLTEE